MQTVPCPQGDKGVCTIPSDTVMITADELTPISRDELTERYPGFDLERSDFARVDAERDAVLELLTSPRDAENGAAYTAVRAAFDRTPGFASVIVTCSCGHNYAMDTE
jgi:hypothetical protein